MRSLARVEEFVGQLSRFPWKSTARTLRERFREDRLALSASSLTFTTTIALVPFLAVVLAVFTAFPMFAKFQDVLQKWLVESLIPDNIARQVLGYLTQFAGKASRLGAVGLAVLFLTALSLVFTIDRTLNSIWRVPRLRPLGQRILIYWTAITLGPLLLAMSLSITAYLLSAARGLVDATPGGMRLLLDLVEFFIVAGAMAATYHYVPNTRVRWAHAWIGGVFVAAGVEIAKKLLALYLGLVPTYSAVYGAFATAPILLIWIYLVWLIVLCGAVIAAYLPSLLGGMARRARVPGWRCRLALEVLRLLQQAHASAARGLSLMQLSAALRVDAQQIEDVLQTLLRLDWVGQLSELDDAVGPRHVLLIDPAATPLAPLLREVLLPEETVTRALWARSGLAGLRLADALDEAPAEATMVENPFSEKPGNS